MKLFTAFLQSFSLATHLILNPVFFPLMPTASLLALLNKDIGLAMETAFMPHCHFILGTGYGNPLRSLPQSSLKSIASGILPHLS